MAKLSCRLIDCRRVCVLRVGLVWLAALSAQQGLAQLAATREQRLPLPTPSELLDAKRSVQLIFGEAVRLTRTSEQKSQLAKDVFSKRAVAENDSERYALLTAALELASQGDDPLVVLMIIDALSKTYATDTDKLQLTTLKRMTGPLSPAAWEALAPRLGAAAEDAINDARFSDAED